MKRIIVIFAAMMLTSLLSAQTRVITGRVDYEGNESLPGVHVEVKGTSIGTITDVNGFYRVEVPKDAKVLVFKFVGCETQEKTIGNSNVINVSMKGNVDVLQEVVVVGHGRRNSKPSRSEKSMGVSYDVSPSIVYYAPDNFNTESYATINETGFRNVTESPLSTFSIDVDNAAYSNVRRFLNNGSLPPQDAVRIEEMLNYFKYEYPEPKGEHPFSMFTELSECPWNSKNQLLHVGLKGMEIDKSELPASNLVFLIDVSGSMSGSNRLPLVKTSLKMLVEELRPIDRVSIVVYASRTEVHLPSTPGSKKREIIAAIESLQTGGYTAGGEALKLAYKVAEENFIKGGNNRIIMATDGDFNVGESSDAAMERLVAAKRETGVFMTVLGYGMGNIKDSRLEIIANKGNGNYSYIDNIQEARKVLVSEFGGTLFTIAKDVKIQIEFNPARVKAYRLIGYENRRLNDEDFNDDKKDAGEMGAGHTVTALYEIVPAGSESTFPGVDQLKYQANTQSEVKPNPNAELLTLKVRYKHPDKNRSVKVDLPVQGKLVPFAKSTTDHRFATAVAEFGLLLTNSTHKGNASFENVIKTAASAKGKDDDGYRAEFINLVRLAMKLEGITEKKEF